VQQPMAFERLVDFLFGVLGPGARRNAAESMVHVMNTLPILPPEDELALKSGGCIMMSHGVVNRPGHAPTRCPAVSFAVQPDKGIGVRAEEDIPPGTVIGPYIGSEAMNSEIGRPYISLLYPSRFVAVVQGNISEVRRDNGSKLSVDGQLTKDRDWRWVKIKHNVGPFLNAPDEKDPADKANCTLDRHSLWRDSDSLLWILIKSRELIRKGSFLQWKYNPDAGGGVSFKFS